MENELEPLPDDLRELLDAERTISPAPVGARARVYARVAASVAAPAVPASGIGGLPLKLGAGALVALLGAAAYHYAIGSSTPEPISTAIAPVAPTPIAAPAAVAPSPRTVTAPTSPLGPLGSVAAAAPVGGRASSGPGLALPTMAPVQPAAARDPRRAAAPSTMASPADLAGERALLEDARTFLAAGDARRALAQVEQHVVRFPRGQLVEEREALRVRALSVSGDAVGARRQADRFRARFPRSIFLPAVDSSIR